MTANAAKLELRNLLKNATDGKRCCTVCGKPESRNAKQVNEACPAHKAAMDADLPGQFRMLEKALGAGLMDFVTKEKFNAQLESIREKLTKAREEHDAYQPEKGEALSSKTVALLVASLGRLGVRVEATDHTPSTVNTLAEKLDSELSKLMEIKAEVAGQ